MGAAKSLSSQKLKLFEFKRWRDQIIDAYSLEPWKLIPLKMVAFNFDKKEKEVVGAKQESL